MCAWFWQRLPLGHYKSITNILLELKYKDLSLNLGRVIEHKLETFVGVRMLQQTIRSLADMFYKTSKQKFC